jgi:hypothetical protein
MIAMETYSSSTTLNDLLSTISYVGSMGFSAGGHDIFEDDVHCGHQREMTRSGIPGIPLQGFTPKEGMDLILEYGGRHLSRGDAPHREREVWINRIPFSTRVQDAEHQVFMVDAWLATMAGIALQTVVDQSLNTVNTLTGGEGVKTVRIFG